MQIPIRHVLSGLCLAAALLAGQPAFADDSIAALLEQASRSAHILADAPPAARVYLDAFGDRARVDVAHLFATGTGVRADLEKARAIWLEASADGNAYAPLALGVLHWNGQDGSAPDVEAALAWFMVAAQRGNRQAESYRQLAAQRLNVEQLQHARDRAQSIIIGLTRERIEARRSWLAPIRSLYDGS